MSDDIQPYQGIQNIGDNIFCVQGEWFGSSFKRKMTIVRLKNQSLVIHSGIQMREEDLARLDALGPVSAIVAPNVIHCSDAPFYSKRYPKAKVFVPAKIRKKLAQKMEIAGTLESDWPYEDELPCISFNDSFVGESVFVHVASRTLIVTDMAFNVNTKDFDTSFERLIFGKWNGIIDQFGPSRLAKFFFARNKKAVGDAIKKISGYEFDRVVVSHGQIVEKDGKRRLLDGFKRIYGINVS